MKTTRIARLRGFSIFFSVLGGLLLLLTLFLSPWTAGSVQAEGAATAANLHTFIIPVAADTEVNTHDLDKNYDDNGEVKVLADNGTSHIHRPLFRYDLSSILPGSTIVTATVHFYVTNDDKNPVEIRRVTVPWDENTVTWNSFNEGYFPTVEGSFTPSQNEQFVSADITALVQQWVSGVRHNRGLVLLPTVEKKDSKFATKESNKLEQISYLEVVVDNSAIHTFADDFAPGGQLCRCDGGDTWTSSWVELGESRRGQRRGCAGECGTRLPQRLLPAHRQDQRQPDRLRRQSPGGPLRRRGGQPLLPLSPGGCQSRPACGGLPQRGEHLAALDSIQLDHGDDGYGYASYDLSAFLSATAQIRLIGEQIDSNTDKGILIDDVRVAYLDSSALNSGIGDRVWDDLNRDNVQDVGEPGLANVGIDLYTGTCGDVEPPAYRTTDTDDNGDYFFPQLFAGNYCLVVNDATLPADYAATADTNLLDVTLATSQIYNDADFGYASAFSNDRLTVGVFAPCTDISWLQTLTTANSAPFLSQDYDACTFTVTGTPANLAQLSLDLTTEIRDRHSVQDVWVSSAYVPNDPDLQQPHPGLWSAADQGPAAWDITRGSSDLIVAVLDTGVDLTHPEFAGRLLPGYDFVNDDADPTDDNGHGTHVAGIIAAAINNGAGMAGMAGNVKILPVKVLNASNTGWWSDVAQGITWAVDQGAKVLNLSLTGTTDSASLRDAIDYANSRGAMVVVAAGNNGSDPTLLSRRLRRSCLLGRHHLHRRALVPFQLRPQRGCWWPPAALVCSTARSNSYQFMSGTSMAAPHAAGCGGLGLSVNPNLTPVDVKQLLLDTATAMGDPNVTGAGLINARWPWKASSPPR